jgi:F-type H+-transporting ATPase subunit a
MFSFIKTAYAAEEAGGISVHLAPTVIGDFFGVGITSTMITVWVSMIFMIILAYFAGKNPKMIPGKLQNFFEIIVGGAYDYVSDVLENKAVTDRYFPVIMTIFVFILGINWIGLIPGVASIGFYDAGHHFVPLLYPAATDLNITIGFAIVAFVTIELAGVLGIGFWKYGGKFINLKFLRKPNFDNILGFVIGLIELISELARLVSFSFRLFGNIFAGKTMLVVAMFFIPYFIPVPIYAYEMFVGVIQATVFAILTLFFIKLALEEPH